jgi:hypothetical protein
MVSPSCNIVFTFLLHPTTFQTEIIQIELWKVAFKILSFPPSNTALALFTSKTLQRENIW